MTSQETDNETEKRVVNMSQGSGKELSVSAPSAPRKRLALSGWFIALLFAEPVVLWWLLERSEFSPIGHSISDWVRQGHYNFSARGATISIIVSIVTLAVVLLLACFRYRQMRPFLKVYMAASLILAVPSCFPFALTVARGGGVNEMVQQNLLTGFSENAFVNIISDRTAPAFVNVFLLFSLVRSPLNYLTKILSVPFVLIIRYLPSWLIVPVFSLCVIVIAAYALLPDKTKVQMRHWRRDTTEHVTPEGESPRRSRIEKWLFVAMLLWPVVLAACVTISKGMHSESLSYGALYIASPIFAAILMGIALWYYPASRHFLKWLAAIILFVNINIGVMYYFDSLQHGWKWVESTIRFPPVWLDMLLVVFSVLSLVLPQRAWKWPRDRVKLLWKRVRHGRSA